MGACFHIEGVTCPNCQKGYWPYNPNGAPVVLQPVFTEDTNRMREMEARIETLERRIKEITGIPPKKLGKKPRKRK